MQDFTGLNIQPDGWKACSWEALEKAEDYSDDSFAGCEYRLPSHSTDARYAINIKVTGRKSHDVGSYGSPWYQTRVKIEYVGDGEESTFDGAWIYSAEPIIN